MSLKNIDMHTLIMGAPTDTVAQAVERMLARRCGALVIMDGDRIVGIFTERDVLRRVVGAKLDPETTRLADVMTTEVHTMVEDADPEEALVFMVRHDFRHLPVLDCAGRPTAIVSIRRIFKFYADNQRELLDSLVSYMGADGPGG